MENIDLRDYLAGQLMSGKVNDFYSAADRKNIAKNGEPDNWIQRTAEEVTTERINNAAKMAYRIADAMIRARQEKFGGQQFKIE
jgi:PDZ domain-containing secreted protein